MRDGPRRAALVAALVALGAAPWGLPRDLVTALLFAFVLTIMAANYDLLGGYLGMHNLGQASFFGLAAYVVFLLLPRLPAPAGPAAPAGPFAAAAAAVLLGGLAAAAFAAAAAYALVRLRGAYFAVGTFALLLLLRLLVDNLPGLTGGAYGLYLPSERYLPLTPAYLLFLALAAGSLVLNRVVAGSRLGLAMVAVRENEATAAAVGIDAFRVRQMALVLGALPTGLAGGLFGLYAGYIDASVVLGTERSLLPVVAAMLGGTGHPWGPVVGAALLRGVDVVLKGYLRLPLPAPALYGLILLGIALALPRGLVALRRPRA